jgi:hypothetical protein
MANRSTVIWIAAAALAMAACKGKKEDTTPKNASAAPKVDPSLCDESVRRVVSFDLNKDGKPDVWHLYNGDVETCKIDDFDHDGRKDWLVAYDAQHQPVYKKADIDYDGKYDLTEVYDNGQVSEVERDSDFDGKLDVKEVYTTGVLSSVRRDRNGDGRPDQWEQYVSGEIAAITYDDDFDGKVDRRDDHPGSAPQATNTVTPPATAPATGTTPPATAPATDTTAPAQPAPTTP